MDKVDRFYEIYSILSESGDKVADHEDEYLEIIQAVKSSQSEKGLACQFIPKFLNHFPHLSKTALEAQLDLAEDDDATVRKLAVKHLPGFCKVSKQLVPKIADILTQMLQSEDSTELSTVYAALITLMELDIKGTLRGIMSQISTGDEEIRSRALSFLHAKLKVLPEDIFSKEVEEFFLESSKKVFPKVSGQDFFTLLSLLSQLKIAKTIPVQNTIVDIIAAQIYVDTEVDVSCGNFMNFTSYLEQAGNYFSPFVSSNKFVFYICLKIFPKLGEIGHLEDGPDHILKIFQILTEISVFIHKDDQIEKCSEIICNEILKYVPLPPDNEDANDSNVGDLGWHFTHVECLLFTFVQFLKHDDKVLTASGNEARFKDLKLRLQYLSRFIMPTLKQIQDSKKTVNISKDENKKLRLKCILERSINNINALIKVFFRNPPTFKIMITFSWKSQAQHWGNSSFKRSNEGSSSYNFARREKRACREIYIPPGGKYSSRVSFSSVKDDSKGKGDLF